MKAAETKVKARSRSPTPLLLEPLNLQEKVDLMYAHVTLEPLATASAEMSNLSGAFWNSYKIYNIWVHSTIKVWYKQLFECYLFHRVFETHLSLTHLFKHVLTIFLYTMVFWKPPHVFLRIWVHIQCNLYLCYFNIYICGSETLI